MARTISLKLSRNEVAHLYSAIDILREGLDDKATLRAYNKLAAKLAAAQLDIDTAATKPYGAPVIPEGTTTVEEAERYLRSNGIGGK